MKRTRLTRRSLDQAPASVFRQICVPPKHFLIANPELEFHVTPIRISDLKFSNRKFFAVFRYALPRELSSRLIASVFFSNLQTLTSNLHLLIETPRLEFLATPTKQSLTPNSKYSNRDKKGVLSSAFRRHLRVERSNKPLGDSVPLWPSCGATCCSNVNLSP